MSIKIARVAFGNLHGSCKFRRNRLSGLSTALCRTFSSSCDEYVIRSPHSDCVIPNVPLHEYVWKDVHRWSSKIALECAITQRKYTYAEARDKARKYASGLRNQLKLKKGDCFAIISPNVPEYPLLLLAASEAGLIATTVNPIYTPAEILKQLANSKAKLIITNADTAVAIVAAMEKLGMALPVAIIHGPVPQGTISLEEVCAASSGKLDPIANQSAEDTVVLPYSSGTTGLPKGVDLCHRNLVANLEQMEHPGVRLAKQTTDTHQENVLGLLPLFHIYGMTVVSLTTLTVGAKLITLPKFEPESFLTSLVKHKISILYGVPPIFIFMGSHPAVKPEMLTYLESTNTGAAPIGHKDMERLIEKAPQIFAMQGYGMTESSPVVLLSHKSRVHKYSSCGVPTPNTMAKVVDITTGKSLPKNARGELWVKGPQVMKGYLNNPEATKEILVDGWLRTGDIGYYDDDGDFYIVDRLKELIKVKGFQVPPAELEEILRSHPEVMDAAVIGVPDERSGEAPRGYIVVKQGSTVSEKDVKAFVAEQVAEYKQLTGGLVIVPQIPKSAAGKILRKDLKAAYLEQLDK